MGSASVFSHSLHLVKWGHFLCFVEEKRKEKR